MGLFKKKIVPLKPYKKIDIQKEIKRAEREDETLWIKCSSCQELLYRKEVERNLNVCPKCSYHFPISVEKRIALTFDKSFTELYTHIEPVDFLKFKDTKTYKARLAETKEATGRSDAVVCGKRQHRRNRSAHRNFRFQLYGWEPWLGGGRKDYTPS